MIAAANLMTMAIGVSSPTCQMAAPPQTTLSITTASLSVPASPFGIVYARESIALVSLGGSIGVLDTSKYIPTLVRTLSLQNALALMGESAVHGLAITQDKSELFAATGVGAIIVDVASAIAGKGNAVVGTLRGDAGTSAIEVTLSGDDNYAFISQEYGSDTTGKLGAVEVFKLSRSSNGSVSSTYVGYVTLGNAVVGSALSPDGNTLYVTSETMTKSGSSGQHLGSLSVLDVGKLMKNPANAVLSSVEAGCSPVRVLASPDGKHVWVTARQSNKLLAFDALKLKSDPSNALIVQVQVGTSPVGSTFINGGQQIITADSNRFNYAGATTGLTVVDIDAALQGTQGFPRISTGRFPREFAVSPNGKTLLVGQFTSKAIQAVDVSNISKKG